MVTPPTEKKTLGGGWIKWFVLAHKTDSGFALRERTGGEPHDAGRPPTGCFTLRLLEGDWVAGVAGDGQARRGIIESPDEIGFGGPFTNRCQAI